ncbi:MAG: two-component system sensor histidine kinase NtrB, partial [Promethearchaeota archaeon]
MDKKIDFEFRTSNKKNLIELYKANYSIFFQMIKDSKDPIAICNQQGEITEINDSFKKILELFDKRDNQNTNIFTFFTLSNNEIEELKARSTLSNKKIFKILSSPHNSLDLQQNQNMQNFNELLLKYNISTLSSDLEGNVNKYIVILKDDTKFEKYQQIMKHNLEFDRILSKLSFIFLGIQDLQEIIPSCFLEIDKFCNFDHLNLVLFKNETKKIDTQYFWHSHTQNYQVFHENTKKSENSWIAPFFYGQKIVKTQIDESHLININDEKVRSLLFYPIIGKTKILGYLGAYNNESIENWNKDLKVIFHLFTELIANYLEEKHIEHLLIEHNNLSKNIKEKEQKLVKFESLGVMLGGIAHDFKNLLTGVIGNIQLAELDLDEQSELNSLLTEAENASMQANDLATQLLVFTKQKVSKRNEIELNPLIKSIATFTLRGSNSYCEFNFSLEVKSIIGDSNEITQVINNIVLNAKQSMPNGGKITISTKNLNISLPKNGIPLKTGMYVEITISDEGCGIKKEILTKIFTPYFTTKKSGT